MLLRGENDKQSDEIQANKNTSVAETKKLNMRHEDSLDPIIDTKKRQPSVVTETKMNQ